MADRSGLSDRVGEADEVFVFQVLADARDGTIYAGLNLGHFGAKLHRSDDRGETWREPPAPAYPAAPQPKGDDGDKGPSVALIWTLAAGAADQPGLIWAGTIPGGLFRSTERGESWSLIATAFGTSRCVRNGSEVATTSPASIRSASIRATAIG